MAYAIAKLNFTKPVHFGTGNLVSHQNTVLADTLFSALCNEADKLGKYAQLIQLVADDKLKLSDTFPFSGNTLFLPKPSIIVDRKVSETSPENNSVLKKQFKKLAYISVANYTRFFDNTLDVAAENAKLGSLGSSSVQTRVNLAPDQPESLPYKVSTYRFATGCGLYCIFEYQVEPTFTLLEELLTNLSFTGIGGKRSSGLGRFTCTLSKLTPSDTQTQQLLNFLDNQLAPWQISLSVALPSQKELPLLDMDASYQVIKRSGFTYRGATVSETFKHPDVFALSSGASFKKRFSGQVLNLGSFSDGKGLYRYLKPLFLGIEVE